MKEVTGEQLNELKKENKKILLDLHGLWCGPCKQLIPKLEQLEEYYEDVVFVKMDVDKNQEYALKLGVRAVPTVMIFEGDNLINRSSGVQPDDYYKKFLNEL